MAWLWAWVDNILQGVKQNIKNCFGLNLIIILKEIFLKNLIYWLIFWNLWKGLLDFQI